MTEWLPDIWCCDFVFNSPDTDMFILNTWYLTLILDMPYLIPELDIWHLMLDMLSPDTRYLINIADTWHLLLGTDTLDLMLWHLTRYYHTWHLYYIAYSWLSLLRGLDIIIILLLYIWYSWTLVLLYSWTLVFLNPYNRETFDIILQILYSCWSL